MNNIYPDLTNSKYDVRYNQAKVIASDLFPNKSEAIKAIVSQAARPVLDFEETIVLTENPPERIVFTTDGFYDIPQYYLLEKFVVQPTADITLRVGSTANGEEYFMDTLVTAAEGNTFSVNIFASVTKRLYFYGITSNTAIVFYKDLVPQT